MSLRVYAFCSYLTRVEDEHPWSNADHAAAKFVKAIKGRTFNGCASIPVNGVIRRLEASNAARAADWFAEWVVKRLKADRRYVLIPVPSSSTTRACTTPSRAADLARRIADRAKVTVHDVLRFSEPLPKASEGGPRWPDELYPYLELAHPLRPDAAATYVLIDDVCTSGGHARACATFLRGVAPLALLCAGWRETSRQPAGEGAYHIYLDPPAPATTAPAVTTKPTRGW